VSQPRRDREQKENWKHPELRRETHNKSKSKISKEETTVSNNVVKEEREKIRMVLSLSFTILKNFKR